jgi:polar amino acid transport system substrate-binding protein
MEDPADINTPKVSLVALRGSTSQQFIETVLPEARLETTDTYDEAVNMVINGTADAMFADYQFCVFTLLRHPDKGLVSIIAPLTYEPLAIAMRTGDPLLVNWVENYINGLKGSGALKEMRSDWFTDPSWISELP